MERFDFDYPPYDMLSHSEQKILQESLNIAFFNDDEVIISPQQNIDHLYVVIKGMIKETGPDGEVLAIYRPRDTFEARALVEGASSHQFAVEEQALVYTIPKATVMQLMESNPRFGAYFYASVAEKLSSLSVNSKQHEFESLFTAKVRDAYRHNTVWLDGSASILDAAKVMKERKSKSVLVKHESQVGLFTESAFRDITIAGASAEEAVSKWSTFNLIAIDIEDFVFNALLRMTQFQIQRVIVLEDGEPVGALEQIDVLAYFSNHTHLVAQRLERAETIDELVDIASQMTQSIQILRNNGVRAPQLAQLMQVLNSSLFEKVWRLLAPPELYENSCLIVMGSEGRGEQILKTDQDNALILTEQADLVLAEKTAAEFSATLERLGYPPCNGKIMVNNPLWRKTLSEFKKMLTRWCLSPSPESMMNLAIFIDAKAVAGSENMLAELKQHLQKTLSNDAGMLMAFARAIELFDTHSKGFFTQLLGRGKHDKMDIKKMGTFPVVHGLRALALEARVEETNSFERIAKLVQLKVLDEQLGKDTAEALGYLMDLRLKSGLSALSEHGLIEPNQVDTEQLSTLERDLLKDALQVVKRFKAMVSHHFHLGVH
ncbi:hypothetical protein PL75_09125 [Neisseria arctica]|uniref:Cyclic nucleotide-binding domain-containing protein n=1 Tax=Neisseria arctica TaxID=1470200 RepID=A0A0J1C1T4_9NEIS|nr:DUF294 nucleotidyltransferase-like domain-containing protein [Neisseria arctica]KLT72233.1 hypothetical protein PL75_09125 [Neisseria arctica]UOO87537.1 DUF294 nucleotidyltransferase-like domain-containing protein [Neisseria arctica]